MKPTELQVVIPYKRLLELLDASRELESLKHDFSLLDQQLVALRHQFTELMEIVSDLKDSL